jgi:hypothetical protein
LRGRHREASIDGLLLLSTPHPALRATFPASSRRGRLTHRRLFENPLLFDKGGLRAFSREPKEEGVQNKVFDERHEIAQSPH